MTIEIETRLYKNIEQWCEVNGIDIGQYITKALTERITLDKYGDLNDRIIIKHDEPVEEEETEEPIVESVEVKNVTNPKAKVEEPVVTETETIVEDVVPEVVVEEQPKETKPKKRKLNSK